MPVPVDTPIDRYTGDGWTTIFTYTFKVLDESDLHVYFDGVEQVSGFVVSGVGGETGGAVTFDSPPDIDVVVRLQRIITQNRLTDYIEGGDLAASVLDNDFDRLVMMVQDLDAVAFKETPDDTLDADDRRIKNVADPINPQDAATKQWSETSGASFVSLAAAEADDSAASASASAISASASAASATLSQKWASEDENVVVSGGEYSAFHWAKKSQQYAIGAMNYRGTWDASTGVYPEALTTGDLYVVSVGGSVGAEPFNVGDMVIYNGAAWDKVDNTDQVLSVAGKTGVVVLEAADIASGTLDIARIPTGTTSSTVALGNHTHDTEFAPISHTHATADVTSGTFSISRIPTGTSGSTVALGNHTHSQYVLNTGDTINGNLTIGGAYDLYFVGDGNIYDTNGDLYIHMNSNNHVALYYNGAEKLRTESGGAKTTGEHTATTYDAISARKHKTKVKDLPEVGELIDSIEFKSYEWKKNFDGHVCGRHFGLIADDQVGKPLLEDMVNFDAEGDIKGFNYLELIALLGKEIQSLRRRVIELEGR